MKRDTNICFRVPFSTKEAHRKLSGFHKREIVFKFNKWIKKQLKEIK